MGPAGNQLPKDYEACLTFSWNAVIGFVSGF